MGAGQFFAVMHFLDSSGGSGSSRLADPYDMHEKAARGQIRLRAASRHAVARRICGKVVLSELSLTGRHDTGERDLDSLVDVVRHVDDRFVERGDHARTEHRPVHPRLRDRALRAHRIRRRTRIGCGELATGPRGAMTSGPRSRGAGTIRSSSGSSGRA